MQLASGGVTSRAESDQKLKRRPTLPDEAALVGRALIVAEQSAERTMDSKCDDLNQSVTKVLPPFAKHSTLLRHRAAERHPHSQEVRTSGNDRQVIITSKCLILIFF